MCKCIELTDAALKGRGLRLVTTFQFRPNSEELPERIPIMPEKLNVNARNVKTLYVYGDFCPFCGEHQ